MQCGREDSAQVDGNHGQCSVDENTWQSLRFLAPGPDGEGRGGEGFGIGIVSQRVRISAFHNPNTYNFFDSSFLRYLKKGTEKNECGTTRGSNRPVAETTRIGPSSI